MILKKIHFAIDKTAKASNSQKSILRKYRNYLPNQSNVIVVIGGDGFMLKTLKKYRKYKKPFYGMNRGTFGFLMNKFKLQNLKKNISRAKLVSISPLEAKVRTKKNKILSAFAINEVSLFRQSRQAASLKIISGKKIIIKKLISDGTILSKPLIEYSYKNDQLGDPLVAREHVLEFNWATQAELDLIKDYCLRINDFM